MKRIAAVVTVAGLLVISTNTVQAENVYPNDYQKIQSTELVEVSIDQDGNEVESIIHRNFNRKTSRKPNRKAGIGKVIKTTKQLMALGKEVYKIVEAGKPVVNFSKNNAVSIVPKPSDGTPVDPMNLQGWKIPKFKKYRIKYKGIRGNIKALFEFMLIFSYGASQNGKGSYITGAVIKATDVKVSWGYNLEAEFRVLSIMNAGTKENPIAAAILEINYDVSTVLQVDKSSDTFYISGKGQAIAY